MWKNKHLFRLAPNKATSDVIPRRCKHYNGRGVMKLCESGGALDVDMGVLASKIKESIAAHCQASFKTAQDPDGGAVPSVPQRQILERNFWQDGFRKEVLPQSASELRCRQWRGNPCLPPLRQTSLHFNWTCPVCGPLHATWSP